MILKILEPFHSNFYVLPVLAVSAIILFIGFFIFFQNRKSIVNFSFFLICLCVALWLFSISFVYTAKTHASALFIYRSFTFLGVSFVAPGVYVFTVFLAELV